MFRFYAALSVSLGLARPLSMATKYVLTLSFGSAKYYEKVDSSSQANEHVYVDF